MRRTFVDGVRGAANQKDLLRAFGRSGCKPLLERHLASSGNTGKSERCKRAEERDSHGSGRARHPHTHSDAQGIHGLRTPADHRPSIALLQGQ